MGLSDTLVRHMPTGFMFHVSWLDLLAVMSVAVAQGLGVVGILRSSPLRISASHILAVLLACATVVFRVPSFFC